MKYDIAALESKKSIFNWPSTNQGYDNQIVKIKLAREQKVDFIKIANGQTASEMQAKHAAEARIATAPPPAKAPESLLLAPDTKLANAGSEKPDPAKVAAEMSGKNVHPNKDAVAQATVGKVEKGAAPPDTSIAKAEIVSSSKEAPRAMQERQAVSPNFAPHDAKVVQAQVVPGGQQKSAATITV